MAGIGMHLDALLARDDASAELVLLHARILLEDAETMADELLDPAVCLAEVRERYRALVQETKGAFSKYPAVSGAGFHSGDPDQRAYMLYSAPSMVQKAGLYTPSDLDQMLGASSVEPAWAAGEALRTTAFMVALRPLLAELDSRRLRASDFPDRCQALGHGFAGIRVARGTPS
ncbi:MAG: hypothetical protein ACKVVT_14270 [Dehalococcoidia bacterium]